MKLNFIFYLLCFSMQNAMYADESSAHQEGAKIESLEEEHPSQTLHVLAANPTTNNTKKISKEDIIFTLFALSAFAAAGTIAYSLPSEHCYNFLKLTMSDINSFFVKPVINGLINMSGRVYARAPTVEELAKKTITIIATTPVNMCSQALAAYFIRELFKGRITGFSEAVKKVNDQQQIFENLRNILQQKYEKRVSKYTLEKLQKECAAEWEKVLAKNHDKLLKKGSAALSDYYIQESELRKKIEKADKEAQHLIKVKKALQKHIQTLYKAKIPQDRLDELIEFFKKCWKKLLESGNELPFKKNATPDENYMIFIECNKKFKKMVESIDAEIEEAQTEAAPDNFASATT